MCIIDKMVLSGSSAFINFNNNNITGIVTVSFFLCKQCSKDSNPFLKKLFYPFHSLPVIHCSFWKKRILTGSGRASGSAPAGCSERNCVRISVAVIGPRGLE